MARTAVDGNPLLRAVTLLAAAVLLQGTGAAAQVADSSAPLILSVPLSVRSAGLNDAGAAIVGHAGALFNNPAGIATVRYVSLEGSYRSLGSESYLTAGTLAWRIRQFDLGLGVGYFDFGSNPSRYGISGVPASSNTREFTSLGSLVYRYGIIALGGTVKYFSRAIDDTKDRALTFDGGVAIAFFDIMAIGFSLQNLGGNWRDESLIPIPQRKRLGFTMNYVDPQEAFRLMSTLEIQWPEQREARFILGVEGGIVVSGIGVIGRGAYGGQPSELDLPQFSYGASLAIARLALDYSYSEADHLDRPVHMFGLRLTL
jgi:hypothetical protein